MSLSDKQYQALKRILRAILSGNRYDQNPRVGEPTLLSFLNQLLDVGSPEVSIPATQITSINDAFRALLSDSSFGTPGTPTVADLSSLFAQLMTEMIGAAQLPAAQYSTLYSIFRDALSGHLYPVSPRLSDADFLYYLNTFGVPLSFYASGGYWDLATMSGSQGDNISAPIASAIGSKLLTPSTVVPPKVWDNAVHGNRAAHGTSSITGANEVYLTCNEGASVFQGDTWTVGMDGRQTQRLDMAWWSALRGDGSSTEQIFGRQSGEAFAVRKKSPTGGTVTYAGALLSAPYDDMRVIWSLVRNRLTIYSMPPSGVMQTDSLGLIDPAVLSAGITRLTFGASVSSVPFEGGNYYFGKIMFSALPMSAAQALAQFGQWRATDYLLSTGYRVGIPGDSITLCSEDLINSAGWRGVLAEFLYTNALSLFTTSSAGVIRQGVGIGNTFTSSLSGQTIAQILGAALTDIASAVTPIRYMALMMGDGDNNAGTPLATIRASYVSAYISIMNAGMARDPLFFVSVSTLLPLSPIGGTIDTGITAFNAAIASDWDSLDAIYPNNKCYRWDAHSAVGGVWTPPCFAPDLAHPNRFGNLQMALHPTFGLLAASNGSTKLGLTLRAASSSVARPVTLVCSVTAPSGGAALAFGVPVIITFNCSRIGGTAVIIKDGSPIGSGTWTEIYDVTSAFGGNCFTNNPQGQFLWTPTSADVGAHTISVQVTDIDTVTVSTSATVSVTVTSHASVQSIFGSAVIAYYDTSLGSSGSTLNDQSGGGHNLTGLGAITADDLTLNNQQTIAIAATQTWVSNLALPRAGTTPTCIISVMKLTTQPAAGGRVWLAAGAVTNEEFVEFLSDDSVRTFNGTAVNVATPLAVGTWQVVRADFSNSSSDIASAGAQQTTGNAGNAAASGNTRNINGYSGTGGGGVDHSLFQLIYLNAIPTPTQMTAYYALIDTLTASTVVHP